MLKAVKEARIAEKIAKVKAERREKRAAKKWNKSSASSLCNDDIAAIVMVYTALRPWYRVI